MFEKCSDIYLTTLFLASSVSPSQVSPSLSRQSTVTTYSLPYYHNLYARSQAQDGKRVHATTYVPEIGTISSPIAGAPSVINVVDTKSRLRDKLHLDSDYHISYDSSVSVISPRSGESKQGNTDELSQHLSVQTSEFSKDDIDCDSKISYNCNNRLCVQSESNNERYVSPSQANISCSELDKTIDLSMKKILSSTTDSQGSKEPNKTLAVRKREESFSSKTNDNENVVAHDLRTYNDIPKDPDSKKCAEKRKACDVNHNSKIQQEVEVSKKLKKSVPSGCVYPHEDIITLTDSDEASDKSKGKTGDSNKNGTESLKDQNVKENKLTSNVVSSKNKSAIKPLNNMKDCSENDKKNLKLSPNTLVEHSKAKSSSAKQTDVTSQSTGKCIFFK